MPLQLRLTILSVSPAMTPDRLKLRSAGVLRLARFGKPARVRQPDVRPESPYTLEHGGNPPRCVVRSRVFAMNLLTETRDGFGKLLEIFVHRTLQRNAQELCNTRSGPACGNRNGHRTGAGRRHHRDGRKSRFVDA